jgi:hypothetical protein
LKIRIFIIETCNAIIPLLHLILKNKLLIRAINMILLQIKKGVLAINWFSLLNFQIWRILNRRNQILFSILFSLINWVLLDYLIYFILFQQFNTGRLQTVVLLKIILTSTTIINMVVDVILFGNLSGLLYLFTVFVEEVFFRIYA